MTRSSESVDGVRSRIRSVIESILLAETTRYATVPIWRWTSVGATASRNRFAYGSAYASAPRSKPSAKAGYEGRVGEASPPALGDAAEAPLGAGDLAVDGGGGVGVVAGIGGKQAAFLEIPGFGERPQGRFQRFHDIAGTDDFRRLAAPEGAARDLADRRA